jgi:glycosyltransferase involved in cell wall biosynthesis
VHLLIESFASMRKRRDLTYISEWKLRIVGPHDVAQGGDGPGYIGELMQLAQPLGLSCTFVGPVFDRRKLIEEYQAASVFVYPSLAEKGEAFGLAPLEAMAAGCAVIVSSLRCFDDFIEDDRNALKFEHRDPNPGASLAAKLERLVMQPSLIEELAKNGTVTARGFQTPAVAGKMLADFESLVGKS